MNGVAVRVGREAAWEGPWPRSHAASEADPQVASRDAYREIAAWWLGSRLLVVACSALVQILAWPRHTWHPSFAAHPLALLASWDGRWYRILPHPPYLLVPRPPTDPPFFPLLPL